MSECAILVKDLKIRYKSVNSYSVKKGLFKGRKQKNEYYEAVKGISMTVETERKVNTMCNLSEVMLERGIEQGIERGIERGIPTRTPREWKEGKATVQSPSRCHTSWASTRSPASAMPKATTSPA